LKTNFIRATKLFATTAILTTSFIVTSTYAQDTRLKAPYVTSVFYNKCNIDNTVANCAPKASIASVSLPNLDTTLGVDIVKDRQMPASYVWLIQALSEMESIKPGMTRTDLLRVFAENPNFTKRGPTSGTYIYRKCPWIKVHVEFEHPLMGKPTVIGAPDSHSKYVITRMSAPFIETPDGLLDLRVF